MRTLTFAGLAMALVGFATTGCSPSKPFDGPTVDAFNGKVVHEGKTVAFPTDEKVELKLFHEKGQQFGIPIKPDGTFKIGWMPIGKYSATLMRDKTGTGKKGAPNRHNVPGGLEIKDGQSDYTIELGKNWKP